MRAVADASPLIYLAKLDELALLVRLYDAVLVPPAVVREVVDEGKARDEPDAWVVERALATGTLEPVDGLSDLPDLPSTLGAGEREVLGVAMDRDLEVLVDDQEAYVTARALGLQPRRTTSLLVEATLDGAWDVEGFEERVARLSREGYFISAEVYRFLVDRVREEVEGA